MFYTIDPYYDVNFYNQSKEALKNNNVNFSEFIEIKSPYRWFLKLNESPIMVNYDKIEKNRFLVQKVQALRPNEEYLLQRRGNSEGTNIKRYIYNDAFRDAEDYGLFFNIKNREEFIRLSREYPGKIYYLGKYYDNKFRVCLVNNPMIKNYILPNQILLEKTPDMKEPGRFEAEFNYKILKFNDFIYKTSETIYSQDGKIIRPSSFDSTNSKYFI
mgnify:CR=1 FL=1